MNRMLRPLLALLFALAASAAPAAGLPPTVLQALRQAGLPPDALAVMLAPTGPYGPPLLHQADRPMQPGSTMKLVTSVVALDRLGPNHRGFTELLATGVAQRGVLGGDLVLRGGADPELGLPQLWALFAELRWKGVHTLEGDIVLDRSLFRPARLDIGVPPFDEAPEFAYNTIPDALTVNGTLMGLRLAADDVLVSAQVWPPLEGVEIINQLQTNERECRDWDEDWRTPQVGPGSQPGRLALTLAGSFPRRCERTPQLALLERNVQIERQLRLVWHGLGGQWTGQVREGVAPAEVRLVARRESRPWGELLRPLNKQSDNMMTRLLYLSLGVKGMAAAPDQATLALAERTVRDWFREHRIDDTGLVLDNGSGLSRSERLTARQLVRLLQHARNGQLGSELMMSLPVAGVDGTMRNRLKNSPATGRARLKSGTLRNVTAVAGYVPDARGRLWVLAAMINHDDAARGRPALDALVDWVARKR